MKLLLVVDCIVTGGAEKILVDYYHYLEKKGHSPYVFALSGNKEQSAWTKNLRVVYGFPRNENSVVKKFFQQFFLFFKLRKLVKQVCPDGIFSFLEKSNLLTILVPAFGCQKVVSVHNVLSIQYTKIHNGTIRKLVYKIIRWAYNRCSNVVAVSKQVQDDMVANFHVHPQNIKVINNFVDRDDIAEKKLESIDDFEFKDGVKYIMNVGRFSDQKAQWKLIKAFSLYIQWSKDPVELILIGDGNYTEKLKELTKKLKIEKNVFFLPFNINPYKYMAKCDLFVLSSIYEGFPIVLAEISSLRKPFVGSRMAIPEELFDDSVVRNDCVFDSVTYKADFTPKIHADEIELAKLLKKSIENESFRQKILQHTSKWESGNLKNNQFYLYDLLLGLA